MKKKKNTLSFSKSKSIQCESKEGNKKRKLIEQK